MHLARIAAKFFLLGRIQIVRLPKHTAANRHDTDCQTVGFKIQSHPAGSIMIETGMDCSEYCRKDLERLKTKLVQKARIGFPMRVKVKWDKPSYYAIDECLIHTRFCIHPWEEFASGVHDQHCQAKTAPQGGSCQKSVCGDFQDRLRGGCIPPSIPKGLGNLCHCEYLLALPKIKRTKSIPSRYRLLEFKKDFSCDHEPVCVRLNGYLNVGIDGWTCVESEALLPSQPCYEERFVRSRKDIAPPHFPCVHPYISGTAKKGSLQKQCDDWSRSPGAAKLLAGREISPSAWVYHDDLFDNNFACPPLDTGTDYLWKEVYEASADLDTALAQQLSPAVGHSSRSNPFAASTSSSSSEYQTWHHPGSLTTLNPWDSSLVNPALGLVANSGNQDQRHVQLYAQGDQSQQYEPQVVEPMQLKHGQLSPLLEMEQRNHLTGELVMSSILDLDEMERLPANSLSTSHDSAYPGQNSDSDWNPFVQCRAGTSLKRKADQMAFSGTECPASMPRSACIQMPSRDETDGPVPLVAAADGICTANAFVLEQNRPVPSTCEEDPFANDSSFWAELGSIGTDAIDESNHVHTDNAPKTWQGPGFGLPDFL